MGVCVLFGAPIMHRMSGLSLAWHRQGVCGHVHLISHSGIVCSGERVGQRGYLFCAKLQKEDRKVGRVRGEEYEIVTSNVLTSSSRGWVVRKCVKEYVQVR